MIINTQIMKDFIEEHETQYVGNYRFHSGYRHDEYAFKVHYYMLDENFRQIDIYVDICFQDKITYTFSEDLHEQEKIYIVKDALNKMIARFQHSGTLHYSLYEQFMATISQQNGRMLETIDFYDILNYMKYHKGIEQKTMDEFYEIVIPCLKSLLQHKNYEKFMNIVIMLFNTILYEYEWDGTSLKYLDTEYQFHLYYVREIIRLVYENLDKFYKFVPEQLFDAIHTLCLNERFSFAIMTDFGSLVLSQLKVTNSVIESLKKDLILNDKDEEKKEANLVFSYIYYIYHSDASQYYAVILKVFRDIINHILTFANHDLDLALGNAMVKSEGYQLILDLFHEDYNTFIFTCFPIDSFPKELRPKVREELITAIQYFAARMDNDNYRLSSFEQVANINRILMDNFKEWYK